MPAELIALAEARQRVLAEVRALSPEEVSLPEALGRVLADEVVPPGRPLGPGQIRDSNATALAAQATRAGARVELVEHVPDEREATVGAVARALAAADVVCVSGGVSVGPHDHVKSALS